MKISTLTQHQALELMGSEATEQEADRMVQILLGSEWDDTKEIPDAAWVVLLQMVVDSTRPEAAQMTEAAFDAAVKEQQEIQKRAPWNDPRKREAHDKIRALVLSFKGVDIGEME